jgi:cell division protein FtsB
MPHYAAYRLISFEKEAYQKQYDNLSKAEKELIK